jgi:hypothetical protein
MRSTLKGIAHRVRDFFIKPLLRDDRFSQRSDTELQIQLKLMYCSLTESGRRLPPISDVGFKVFSQTDEDGILLYIFSIIGALNKKCVEICAGNGIECNTANLIINHGWSGLLVDGNESLVNIGQEFYKKNPHTRIYPPTFIHSWITRDNVNNVIGGNGFEGPIDLLSVDMDGVDYWIWEAIEIIQPRVVVVEYQDIIGPDKALTVPYKDEFTSSKYSITAGFPDFCGASLGAFVKLGRRKGYRLIGCNRYGYNAFFIRDSIGEKELPEIPIGDCFKHPKVVWGMKERFPKVKDLPWVEV